MFDKIASNASNLRGSWRMRWLCWIASSICWGECCCCNRRIARSICGCGCICWRAAVVCSSGRVSSKDHVSPRKGLPSGELLLWRFLRSGGLRRRRVMYRGSSFTSFDEREKLEWDFKILNHLREKRPVLTAPEVQGSVAAAQQFSDE